MPPVAPPTPQRPLRSSLLRAAARATFAIHALAAANAIAGTADDAAAPRFLPKSVPTHLADGRSLPDRFEWQSKNALQRLRDQGRLPAHPGITWGSIKKCLPALAIHDFAGNGAYCSLATWAYEAGVDVKTCRKVQQWAVEAGFMEAFPRGRRNDRIKRFRKGNDEADGVPWTPFRSTVRVLYLAPVAMNLSTEQLLDLIALQDPDPEMGAPHREEHYEPVYDQESLEEDDQALEEDDQPSPQLAAHHRAIQGPLSDLAALTGIRWEPAFPFEAARDVVVDGERLVREHVIETVRELVALLRTEQRAAQSAGKTARRYTAESLGRRLMHCFESKLKHLQRPQERARAAVQSAAREASWETEKTTQAAELEEALAKRRTVQPEELQEPAVDVPGVTFHSREALEQQLAAFRAELEAPSTSEGRRADIEAWLDLFAKRAPP